jgi:hypothetical protein
VASKSIHFAFLTAASYFAGRLTLPLGQTFYTILILPMLWLLAAEQFVRLWSQRLRSALELVPGVIGWWGVAMIQY